MSSNEVNKQKVKKLIDDIKDCMLVTSGPYGHLESRPMHAYVQEDDSNLWFFTSKDSEVARQIEKNGNLNLSFLNTDKHIYLSVVGKGQISLNFKMMKDLWNPLLLAWFPQGLEDPNLRLIKVEPLKAELWQDSSNSIITLYGMAKSILQGEVYQGGHDSRITVNLN